MYLKTGNLSYIPPKNQIPFATGLWAGISATSWAYTGMTSICYMTGEFKNPGKTMPRALIGSGIIVTILYTLISVAVVGLMPFEKLTQSSAPIADALTFIPSFSGLASQFVAGAAIIVVLGSLSSCIMYQPRMEYAMAKDGLFFKIFGHVHMNGNSYELVFVALKSDHAHSVGTRASGDGDMIRLGWLWEALEVAQVEA